MTQRERIARFERLGLGLFVHFGVFSVPEGGEWHQAASKESAAEYARYLDRFFPKKDWAEERLSARPAPWHVEPKVVSMPCCVPVRT